MVRKVFSIIAKIFRFICVVNVINGRENTSLRRNVIHHGDLFELLLSTVLHFARACSVETMRVFCHDQRKEISMALSMFKRRKKVSNRKTLSSTSRDVIASRLVLVEGRP